MEGLSNYMRTVAIRDFSFKGVLASGVCALALSTGLPGIGHAQENGSSEQALEEIMVTGSRIQRTGMSTPTPVTSVTGQDLQNMAPTTLVEALVQLPQFLNNNTPQTQSFGSSGAAGASYVNLRGIGANRTLTLLDGRRVVPSTRNGTVNISLLPQVLVERVEVVTGGASAAYGSDAVSGVVNFILDTDFTGIKGNVQGGITGHGDNENVKLELAGGTEIGDRAHLVVSGEYYRADGVKSYEDRDWYDNWAVINNPGDGPARLLRSNVRSSEYTYGGLITSGPLAGTQFLDDGTTAPFSYGELGTDSTHVGGDGVDPGRDRVWLMPNQERYTAFAHLKYELTEDIEVFFQGLYGHSMTSFNKAPVAQWGGQWSATVFDDNAYLPSDIATSMDAAGIDQFTLGRMASADDLGAGFVRNKNNMLSLSTGFKGETSGWRYNGYYQYGRNKSTLHYSNTARLDHLYRSMDAVVDPATGDIVCRSTLSNPDDGCVPGNFFGAGNMSQEAIDYIVGDEMQQNQLVEQHAAEATAQRELFENWAGTVSLALGGSYRKETLDNYPSSNPPGLNDLTVPPDDQVGYKGLPATYDNNENIFERTAASTVNGGYDVWEVFGETLVPLLRDVPAAQLVELNAAVRYADYSGSGGVVAWKGGLDWQVFNDLRLRATRSRDVRAGTLSERFDSSGTGATIEDPQNQRESYAVTAIRGGNPNVDPEKADTTTFGVVYQPSWLPGLGLSVDYFDVKIKGAISTLGAQTILDDCAEGATALCDLVTRNPATGLIETIDNTYQNVDEARTKGVDFELTYFTPISVFGGGEDLNVRGFATYLDEISTTNYGAPKVDRAGQVGLFGGGGGPEWQANVSVTYNRGPLSIFVQERFIDGGTLDATWVEGVDVDDNQVDSAFYTSLRVSYDLEAAGGSYTIYGHVNNLFDANPRVAPLTWGFLGSTPTNEGLYDVLGRRYTVGLRFNY